VFSGVDRGARAGPEGGRGFAVRCGPGRGPLWWQKEGRARGWWWGRGAMWRERGGEGVVPVGVSGVVSFFCVCFVVPDGGSGGGAVGGCGLVGVALGGGGPGLGFEAGGGVGYPLDLPFVWYVVALARLGVGRIGVRGFQGAGPGEARAAPAGHGAPSSERGARKSAAPSAGADRAGPAWIEQRPAKEQAGAQPAELVLEPSGGGPGRQSAKAFALGTRASWPAQPRGIGDLACFRPPALADRPSWRAPP